MPAAEALAQGCRQLAETLNTLRPFVPPPLLDLYLADPGQSRGVTLRLPGTILAVDLAESPLAVAAGPAGEGRAGSEISELVIALFGQLADEIAAQGGYVVQFAGDALTAFFAAGALLPDAVDRLPGGGVEGGARRGQPPVLHLIVG